MRFSHINNVTIIAITSLVLSIIGFVLDLHERVQDVKVNVFEILMVTAIIFTVLCSIYAFIFIAYKLIIKLKRIDS